MPQLKSAHHHGNLRAALIEYAIEAAQAGRLEDLSLRQATQALGVSPGAAYRHFTDRDDLLHAVAQRGFDMLAQSFEAAMPYNVIPADAAAAKQRFHDLGRAYVRFACHNHSLWRLMFGPYGFHQATEQGMQADGQTGGQTDGQMGARASTYDWLAKALNELYSFDLITAPTAQDQFFAWTAIHGLSDLQRAPAMDGIELTDAADQQVMRILKALQPIPNVLF